MAIPLFVVDAFTAAPFAGNPAGVCLLPGPAPDPWMAAVAAEVNLSETAFCWPEDEARRLRWFTPKVEVPLCGHATLATARVLFDEGGADPGGPLTFRTLSGELTATPAGGGIELNFPAQTAAPLDAARTTELEKALGVPLVSAATSGRQILGETRSAADVRDARPDLEAVAAFGGVGAILTAAGEAGVDYVLRYFAPNAGVAEDPVTGSAQCLAGPYWAARTGRSGLVAHQLSARGGTLRVGVGGERVTIGGEAVIVFAGHLRGPAAAF